MSSEPTHPESEGPILGIDLGTTCSAVGVVEAGFPILLAGAEGRRLLPSVVHFPPGSDHSEAVVGEAALRSRALHPERTLSSVKRLIGRRPGEVDWRPPFPVVRDEDGKVRIPVDDRQYLPEEISTLVLTELRSIAEEALGQTATRAVVTVPAYFNEGQRAATKRAAENAGLVVERLLAEPTAAALAFGLDKGDDTARKIAVYDLGGGTFDLSILHLRDGVFEVLATQGDTALGGDDFDRAILQWMVDQADLDLSALDPGAHARLGEAAIAAKIALSEDGQTQIEIPFLTPELSVSLELRRSQFEKLIAPILARSFTLAAQALADANLQKSDLDEVILVGGSTRIPQVRSEASEFFGREPDTSAHPDEAIALGATIQAGVLSGAMQDILLLDVTPLSLGIETFGGLMNVIIPRNTTIPVKAGELFTNAMAGQREMEIRILQGEREMADDNWELGRIAVPFEEGPKGSARVGVQFSIDADGLLQVLARDTVTLKDHVLEINDAAVDVDDDQVEAMIAESVEFAFEDMDARRFTEVRLKAEELLPAVEQGLAQVGSSMPVEQGAAIRAKADRVVALLAEGEGALAPLKQAVSELDASTQDLAVLLVEAAMAKALEAKLQD